MNVESLFEVDHINFSMNGFVFIVLVVKDDGGALLCFNCERVAARACY